MKEVISLSKLQKDLISAAYECLKPNGVLVYSTCTLDPAENEEVVDFLLNSTNAEVCEIKEKIKARKGLRKYNGKKFCNEIKKCLRIHPQDLDTEGFFVAKIKKPG